jgi:ketosteroid isomerase-like protein
MRASVAFALTLVLSVPTAACEAPAPDRELGPEDRASIEAIPQQYADLLLADDLDGLADLFHPQGVRMPPNAPTEEGRQQIRAGLEFPPGVSVSDFAAETLEVDGIGDLAYSRGTFRLELNIENDDEPVLQVDEGDWVGIFRRTADGDWILYRLIWNSNLPLEELVGS